MNRRLWKIRAKTGAVIRVRADDYFDAMNVAQARHSMNPGDIRDVVLVENDQDMRRKAIKAYAALAA